MTALESVTAQVRRDLLDGLRKFTLTVKAGEQVKYKGVCDGVYATIGAGNLRQCMLAMRGLCARWPDGTGSSWYPIPLTDTVGWAVHKCEHGSDAATAGEYQYEWCNDKWKGEQKAYRLKFMQWCIDTLTESLAGDDDD